MTKEVGIQATPQLFSVVHQILNLDTTTTRQQQQQTNNLQYFLNNYETTTTTTNDKKIKQKNKLFLPLSIVSSIQDSIHNNNTKEMQELKIQFEYLLNDVNELVFQKAAPAAAVPDNDDLTEEKRRVHRARMERLRKLADDREYKKLTSNVGNKEVDNEAPQKNMTYAASIGMNMILAPISLGVFVYIATGKMVFDDTNDKKSQSYRIIISVLAGVALLFIEMILFVIRSHTMDVFISKKKKKSVAVRSNNSYYTTIPASFVSAANGRNKKKKKDD